jgi:hydroxymethylpyrimidine/phosphomethylpyrimidine kinase
VNAPPCILTIAGSDSGGGAGIQADQRTIQALGGHALTAITAVTAQDGRRISAWSAISDNLIRSQVESAITGFRVAAAKTGLLPGAGAVRAVAQALAQAPGLPLVVDPVLASSSGTPFLSAAGIRALKKHLFPIAALITPNWPEAEILWGRPVRNHAEAEKAAVAIAAEFGRPVLVKGGHAEQGPCRDCLAVPLASTLWFDSPRVRTNNTHGTGCVLSSAIATWLGRGSSLPEAVLRGRHFLLEALAKGRVLRWKDGRGPALTGNS